MNKFILAFITLLSAALLVACGEQPQVVPATPGTSAARPDDKPYANEKFNNDRAAWERQLRVRADYQNDYKRMN